MRPSRLAAAALAALLMASNGPAVADVQYVYDSSGRMIRAIYSNGVTVEYRYDAAGNRTMIIADEAPNTAPVAVNDTAAVSASSVVNVMVLSNDTDAENNTLVVTAVGAPTGGGSVAIQGGGTHVRYTAPATTGAKTFTYTISDGAGGTDSAIVTVTVSSANAAPVAADDLAGATMGTSQTLFVLGNDTDANGHTLTVTAISGVTGGAASIGSGGSYVVYTAPMSLGVYTFNYTVSDGHGGTDVGAVTINVTSGEGPPCDPRSGDQCDINP